MAFYHVDILIIILIHEKKSLSELIKMTSRLDLEQAFNKNVLVNEYISGQKTLKDMNSPTSVFPLQ